MLDIKYGEKLIFLKQIRTPATREKSLNQPLVIRLQFLPH